MIDHSTGPLTKREYDVALLVADGLRYEDIAARLFVEYGTVKNRLTTIYRKLKFTDTDNKSVLLARWVWEREQGR